MKNIKKRNKTFFYQRHVPKDIREKFGKSYIEISVGKDIAVAEAKAKKLHGEHTLMFEALRGNSEAHKALPREIYRKTLKDAREGSGALDHAYDWLEQSNYWIDEIQTKVEKAGVLPKDPIPQDALAALHAIHDHQKEIRGDSLPVRPQYGMSFSDASQKYLDDISHKTNQKTMDQYHTTARLFGSFVNDKPLIKVTPKDVITFYDILKTFSLGWGKSPGDKVKPFSQLKTKYAGRGRLSDQTMNRHIMALSSIWKWSKQRMEVDGDNPFDGLLISKGKINNKTYLPFDQDELKLLFNPESKDKALHQICLVALHSGMRRGEICSLQWENIRQEDDVWFFDIVAAKTEAGVRRVPIHKNLLWLLDGRSKEPKDHLWPRHSDGDKFGKKFTRFKRERGLTSRQKTFHSFRKCVTRYYELNGVPQNEAASILGHEKAGITYRVYNPTGLTLGKLQLLVNKLEFIL
ncbi:tyrosine-type recombinase/integrase [Paremcibacter congregatus]|uniref:Tyr recombinase domain-containing protein n=1 Tax=Paremcibacter congregatus TaxID=2043170 RepID=A0A2G4YWW6_9PROT|nr:tyrosine-type recombinase/integrase [Paremcibacter congregatus]PHZ85936.1 hypothetical protein CRD36_04475 [Paremcibacter congregatus]QDE26901.1 hypothetical protein FIV45_06245 [Paremcibacter congregatus]